jgi:hypothetical protein
MLADVEHWLGNTPPSSADDFKRLTDLEKMLVAFGFHYPYQLVMRWHGDYSKSGRYPFGAGAYGEQPATLHSDFATLELLLEREKLRAKFTQNKTDDKPPIPKASFPLQVRE